MTGNLFIPRLTCIKSWEGRSHIIRSSVNQLLGLWTLGGWYVRMAFAWEKPYPLLHSATKLRALLGIEKPGTHGKNQKRREGNEASEVKKVKTALQTERETSAKRASGCSCRFWAWFPAVTRWLTTVRIFGSRRSSALSRPLLGLGFRHIHDTHKSDGEILWTRHSDTYKVEEITNI